MRSLSNIAGGVQVMEKGIYPERGKRAAACAQVSGSDGGEPAGGSPPSLLLAQDR